MAGNTRTDGGPVVSTVPARKSAPPRRSAARTSVPRKSAGKALSGRAAARKVDEAHHFTVELPLLGSVRLPEPQQLTYYAAIGALGVIGVLEWPIALVLAGGHALATNQHNQVLQQFGEALEDA